LDRVGQAGEAAAAKIAIRRDFIKKKGTEKFPRGKFAYGTGSFKGCHQAPQCLGSFKSKKMKGKEGACKRGPGERSRGDGVDQTREACAGYRKQRLTRRVGRI